MVGRVVNTLGFPIDGKDQSAVHFTKCHSKKLLELFSVSR
jgi:F0F1-type ATP synthase alpha subunit